MTSVKINYTDNPIESIEWDFVTGLGSAEVVSGVLWIRQGGNDVCVRAEDIQAFAEALLKMARQGVK